MLIQTYQCVDGELYLMSHVVGSSHKLVDHEYTIPLKRPGHYNLLLITIDGNQIIFTRNMAPRREKRTRSTGDYATTLR